MVFLDIDNDRKLVIVRHIGEVTISSLTNAWLTFIYTKSFRELGFNLLSDCRGAKFIFRMNELGVARSFMKEYKTILQGKKAAMITDEPYTTAVGTLFERFAYEDARMVLKVFSTEGAALKWVMNCKFICLCSINNCVRKEPHNTPAHKT